MKKVLPILASIFSFVFLFSVFRLPSSTKAQTPYTRAHSDYQFNLGRYRDAHAEYSLAKNRYLAAKTLASRQAAFEATKKMLGARSKVLDTYFTALSIRFLDTKPQEPLQGEILTLIGAERNFLAEHQEKLAAQTTLESILEVSGGLEERQKTFRQTANKTLATILLQEQKNWLAEVEVALTAGENIISRMDNEGKDVTLPRSWVAQIKDKLTNARNGQTEAEVIIDNFDTGKEGAESLFSRAQKSLEGSGKELLQAISFLKELTELIKRT